MANHFQISPIDSDEKILFQLFYNITLALVCFDVLMLIINI